MRLVLFSSQRCKPNVMMAPLILLLHIFVLDEAFANFVGLTFRECDETLCRGKEPNYPSLESRNVSSRVACLIRCLNNDYCNFVGYDGNVCTLYTTPNLANDMRASSVLWRFWTRRKHSFQITLILYACINILNVFKPIWDSTISTTGKNFQKRCVYCWGKSRQIIFLCRYKRGGTAGSRPVNFSNSR